MVALRNAVQLREEAQAMRNCVGNYEAACRSGRTVVFSIRKGDRRVANMTAWRAKGKDGMRWAEPEIAGKANRAVPDLGGLARRVMEML